MNKTTKRQIVYSDEVFFTSDHHFGHKLMAAVGKGLRPFNTTREMNQSLIEEWNKVVPKDGLVYHLGDFSLTSGEITIEILDQLNGDIVLLKGNHYHTDQQVARTHHKIIEFADYASIYVKEFDHQSKGDMQLICMSHYPMLVWDKSHYGSWMLHGHCHGNLEESFTRKSFDVGIDTLPYRPYTYQEVQLKMEKKKFIPIDHHS